MRVILNLMKRIFSHGISETEDGIEFILLLRIQAVLYIAYFLVLSVMLAAGRHYLLSFLVLAGCTMLCISYVCTMSNRLHLSLVLLASCFWSVSFLLSIGAGFDYHFYWILVTLVPILYFNTTVSIHENIPYASLLTLTVIILFFIDLLQKRPSLIANKYIIITNMILLLLSLTSSAYLGKERFKNSENQIRLANQKLRNMANQDSLTSLPNRRAMNQHLREASIAYLKKPNPFCIAIGDIDLFKRINDTFGHDAGDAILISISEIFTTFMEKRGSIARWGGEEFLFCFTDSELEDATKQLELLRKLIHEHEFHFQEKLIPVTMTFGIEVFQEHLGIENTISRADEKLYNGKEAGRNRVVS